MRTGLLKLQAYYHHRRASLLAKQRLIYTLRVQHLDAVNDMGVPTAVWENAARSLECLIEESTADLEANAAALKSCGNRLKEAMYA